MKWKGTFAVPQPNADTAGNRLQFGFQNNDRNLQLKLPITVNITCTGVSGACFVPAPAPKPVPPPAPLPPAPPPPHKTGTSWENIGPKNIGDDIYGRGEAGTIDAAVSVIGNPNLMYMGGTNNAASPGVLKSTDYGTKPCFFNLGFLLAPDINRLVHRFAMLQKPAETSGISSLEAVLCII